MSAQRLYLLIGYPGSGKTSVSRIICQATGAVHLWADHERLKMFGHPTHAAAESKLLYDRLNEVAAHLLAEGKSVIFDTNFNFRKDRDHLRGLADKQGAQTVVVWLVTPKEVAKQRAVHDRNLRNGYEVAMPESDFERMASHLEPPAESENFIKIDGTNLIESEVKRLLDL